VLRYKPQHTRFKKLARTATPNIETNSFSIRISLTEILLKVLSCRNWAQTN